MTYGDVIYASLAQMSVTGVANTQIDSLAVGTLDIFSSAFYTHTNFALAETRLIESDAQIGFTTNKIRTFTPPRAFDVIHNLFVVMDIPGLIDIHSAGGVDREVVCDLSDVPAGATDDGTHLDDYVFSPLPMSRYQQAVGQRLTEEIVLRIGGNEIAKLDSLFIFVYEELMGHAGRRQLEMIGKVPVASHDVALDDHLLANAADKTQAGNTRTAGTRALEQQSTVLRRLYVQIPFWFTGGKLDRALKIISMQLHRIEFQVTIRALSDAIFQQTNQTAYRIKADGTVDMANDAVTGTRSVHPRSGEQVRTNQGTNGYLSGAVRSGALIQRGGAAKAGDTASLSARFGVDFLGCYLNNAKRQEYLQLDERALFQYVQSDTPPAIERAGMQTRTLDFQNAVHSVFVTIQNGPDARDPWALQGTGLDTTNLLRDDPLLSLDFSLAATDRTPSGLESQWYRHAYPLMTASLISPLKGLYYFPLNMQNELNQVRIVSGFINCSKIDDFKVRYNPNNAAYKQGDGSGAALQDKKLSDNRAQVRFYACAYNLLTTRNGMSGKAFQ